MSSRWIENFQSHQFQVVWQKLKDDLSETKVSDETIITDVTELARLVKVVGYVDGIIHAIDPDLVPLNTWDSFRDQASNCQQQVESYKSNRNIAHISSANAHADNLLTYVRPYMITEGKIGNVLQKAIKDYAKIITEYGDSFRNKSHELLVEIKQIKNDTEESFNAISDIKRLIDELNIELFGANLDDGTQAKIRTLVSEVELKYQAIGSLYNEILIGDENNLSTKKKISMANEAVLDDQKSIKEILKNIEEKTVELTDFHSTIFGEVKDGAERSGGLSADFSARIEALKVFETEQKTKYNALNEEIETLLPGATSAGLANAYSEMKNSFNKPIKNAALMFYISLGVLIIAAILMSIDSIGGNPWITFSKPDDWDGILKNLVYKVPLYASILWLAFYSTKRRSEYQRLQQEYSHKEAFAKSYHNYKLQLQNLKDQDATLQVELIKKAIDAISYNASQTLDQKHGDKMPIQEIIEKTIDKSFNMFANSKQKESK